MDPYVGGVISLGEVDGGVRPRFEIGRGEKIEQKFVLVGGGGGGENPSPGLSLVHSTIPPSISFSFKLMITVRERERK